MQSSLIPPNYSYIIPIPTHELDNVGKLYRHEAVRRLFCCPPVPNLTTTSRVSTRVCHHIDDGDDLSRAADDPGDSVGTLLMMYCLVFQYDGGEMTHYGGMEGGSGMYDPRSMSGHPLSHGSLNHASPLHQYPPYSAASASGMSSVMSTSQDSQIKRDKDSIYS